MTEVFLHRFERLLDEIDADKMSDVARVRLLRKMRLRIEEAEEAVFLNAALARRESVDLDTDI